jgi:hypothetical protein
MSAALELAQGVKSWAYTKYSQKTPTGISWTAVKSGHIQPDCFCRISLDLSLTTELLISQQDFIPLMFLKRSVPSIIFP